MLVSLFLFEVSDMFYTLLTELPNRALTKGLLADALLDKLPFLCSIKIN